ncbi:hypothetical protein E1301_Tti001679 [Triplophysa tibetana]|uniref:Uncharacterized protein n=1 Tax=Triplophysa tibetana TaxID=1572043 RepID=A0A5A9P170_9TELE|nr:hypothetical protein E1301_Tti001679 [Triplophysa tibetana]
MLLEHPGSSCQNAGNFPRYSQAFAFRKRCAYVMSDIVRAWNRCEARAHGCHERSAGGPTLYLHALRNPQISGSARQVQPRDQKRTCSPDDV